jgi:hypothetical protein
MEFDQRISRGEGAVTLSMSGMTCESPLQGFGDICIDVAAGGDWPPGADGRQDGSLAGQSVPRLRTHNR